MIELRWEGPFGWPGLNSKADKMPLEAASVASDCGVYLWTIQDSGGFLIYTAGITRRPFLKRFREHTRAYRKGVYTIFDVTCLKQGIRKKIWPGFWFGARSVEKQEEYDRHSERIELATDELLSNYNIFVASVDPDRRLLERIEASIMNNLYAAKGAVSVIPDRGMALAPRWPEEKPILVRSISPVLLHGLPNVFNV